MGARQKLNAAHVNGALVVGVVVAVLSGSWLLALAAAAGMLYSSCQSGGIRPDSSAGEKHCRSGRRL